jgi:ADP-ribose pyrophosphatase YjhB (NUDIX family)
LLDSSNLPPHQFLRQYFPKGKETEWLNVYPEGITDFSDEPLPIGLGNRDHTHPEAGSPIFELMKETQRLPFLHGNVTRFMIATLNGEPYLLNSVRSALKRKYPGLVESITVGGHVTAGESLSVAATREFREELGWKAIDFEFLGANRYGVPIEDNTYDFVGLTHLSGEQTGELRAVMLARGVEWMICGDIDSLERHMPDRIGQTTGRSVEERTNELLGATKDEKEIAYFIACPFALMTQYFNRQSQAGLDVLARQFAWINVDQGFNGNFLANSTFIDAALARIASFC